MGMGEGEAERHSNKRRSVLERQKCGYIIIKEKKIKDIKRGRGRYIMLYISDICWAVGSLNLFSAAG